VQALYYANLTTQSLQDSLDGSTAQLPEFHQGDQLLFQFRFAEDISGETIEVSRNVSDIRAILGRVDSPPDSGTLRLLINGVATNNLTYHNNCLDPISFVRQRAWQCEDTDSYHHEIRLKQAAVAQSAAWGRVNPQQPSIERFEAGSTVGDTLLPEIQSLSMPSKFRGTYRLVHNSLPTDTLSVENTDEEIAEALNAIAADGEEFEVEYAQDEVARIEFRGDMLGSPQDLLEIQIVSIPEGDLTLTLNLAKDDLAPLFRDTDEVDLPFTIRAVLEDVHDDQVERKTTLFHGEVTVHEQIGDDSDNPASNIDWLRPPWGPEYPPVDPSSVITGSQHYPVVVGDGVQTVFTVDHEFGTKFVLVDAVDLTTGAPLERPGDYNYTSTDDSTTYTFVTAPATNNVGLILTAAISTDAIAAHVQAISTITGLQDVLNDYGTRLAALEALPGASFRRSVVATGTEIMRITLPNFAEVYPLRSRAAESIELPSDLSNLDITTLPSRASGLLPAVHDAAAASLPTETFSGQLQINGAAGDYAGQVFVNDSGNQVYVPGGLGRRGRYVAADEHVASDGRVWYVVEQYGDGVETSYYPADFSRELFRFFINEKQLRLGTQLDLQFALQLAVFNTNTNYHWTLVIETGQAGQETDPATTGVNLANITWDATPKLEQRLIVTPQVVTHTFGALVTRQTVSSVDTLSMESVLYGAAEATDAPASNHFAIRGRLLRPDTEDSISDPEGFVGMAGFAGGIESDDGVEYGVAKITT